MIFCILDKQRGGRRSSLVLVNYDMYCGHTESVDLTSEVVGDGECSLRARAVFSSSEMSMITGLSGGNVLGECGRVVALSLLARLCRMVGRNL